MWTHSEFVKFFRGIASSNKHILHSEAESHFVRIIPVDDPFASLNTQQYVGDKRSKLHMPALMLQVPQTLLRDPGDSITANDELAFFIMDKPETVTYDDEDACITKTENIAKGVVGYLRKYFRELQTCPKNMKLVLDGLMIDKIEDKPFWGTKVTFRITAGANAEFAYNDADWVD